MNIIIGAVGAQLTLSVISGVTSAANGMYTLCSTVASSTSNGAVEVKQIINETDLEFKVKHAQSLLCELKITENTPKTIEQCIDAIYSSIKEISEELDVIYYRMQYNDNLWVGSSFRAYKFHNCRSRLEAKLKNLDARRDALIKLIPIQSYFSPNPGLEEPSKLVLQIEQVDPKIAKKAREEIHKKLTYIKK